MSLMLKALQRIEARSPQPRQRSRSVPPGELDSPPPRLPEDGPQLEQEIGSGATESSDSRELSKRSQAPPSDFPGARWPVLPTAEHVRAYGELAGAILSQFPEGRPAALMFTSPGDGEGKTGTLVALAAALVERTRGEVLVVDGNLHKPALAGRLGVQSTRGLADVLMGTANWRQVVRSTVVPRLSVLPGVKFSTPGGRPPERLNLRPLLKEVGSEYRLVLIDTASLTHREVAPMARYCDGTYLVVRLGHTTRRAIGEAARVIENCGGRVLGSVVIGV